MSDDSQEDLLNEQELIDMARRGEIEVDAIDQPKMSDTFTAEN